VYSFLKSDKVGVVEMVYLCLSRYNIKNFSYIRGCTLRFLKSNTVGVVDSIAAEAISALSRFVDGAGLAFVDIIDSLPTAINSMTDAVDGVVRTVDHIGRVSHNITTSLQQT
jgi:hypothetical protein